MVIAHFRSFRTAIPSSLFLAVCTYGYWIPLSYPGGLFSYLHAKPDMIGYIATVWLLSPLAIAFCCAILFRIVFRRGVALWADKDAIVYIHPLFRHIRIRDIQKVSLLRAKTLGSPLLIAFDMTSGKILKVGTVILVESVEEIFSAFQNMGIPVASSELPVLSDR